MTAVRLLSYIPYAKIKLMAVNMRRTCSTLLAGFGIRSKDSLLVQKKDLASCKRNLDKAIFGVANWKPSDFRILQGYACC